MDFNHKSVLFEESISSLNLSKEKIIVDATAGGGGHSSEIAKQCGTLIALDRDPDAIEVLKDRLSKYKNTIIVNSNFSDIKSVLSNLGIEGVDGILMDLGVSSYQLDEADRGFSYHNDAPLDMRMSKKGQSAYDVVNNYSEEELANIIFKYGEDKFARRIAKEIIKQREKQNINTTLELAEIIKNAYPAEARRKGHPARKAFQAIRIEVNDELGELSRMLNESFDCLNPGGRLSIITFHSLEDRMVKEKINEWCVGCTCPKDFPICVCGGKPKGKKVFKFKKPTTEELEENPRARSSKLRCFEKY